MYDKHPNKAWSEYFYHRILQAYAIYPVVVVPERYTHEPGYVSDTESTSIVFPQSQNKSEIVEDVVNGNNVELSAFSDIKRQEL